MSVQFKPRKQFDAKQESYPFVLLIVRAPGLIGFIPNVEDSFAMPAASGFSVHAHHDHCYQMASNKPVLYFKVSTTCYPIVVRVVGVIESESSVTVGHLKL